MNTGTTAITAYVQAARAVAACLLGYCPTVVHAGRSAALQSDFGFDIEPAEKAERSIAAAGVLGHLRWLDAEGCHPPEDGHLEVSRSGLHPTSTTQAADGLDGVTEEVAEMMERFWPIVDHIAYTLREID
ncbi:MAG: hypothetical protein KAI24_00325, partial [Planctomycetes bacterium]|nr:hypothetical protein [Planctomycetota bacterium]